MIKKIAILLFATACAHAPSHPKTVDYGDFKIFVERFVADAAYVGKNVVIDDLIIQWGDLSQYPNRVGECHTSAVTTPTIIIDKTAWPAFTDAERVALLYHEMGHCVLGRGHTTYFASFLYPWIHSEDYVTSFYPQLVQELFDSNGLGPEYYGLDAPLPTPKIELEIIDPVSYNEPVTYYTEAGR